MMHTPEEASALWCPMARVAQGGHTDIQAAYNRTLTKQHIPTRMLKVRDPEDFELGQESAEESVAMVLETQQRISMASMCLGDKCAMWRWGTTEHIPAHMEPGKLYAAERVQSTTHGYCGLAGRPEVL